jgi:hypothetical protein
MKTQVYEYTDTITYHLPRGLFGKLEPDVKNAITKNLTGQDTANIVKDGYIVTNPLVESHSRFKELQEAHYKVNSSSSIKVKVRVYSDGSKELEIIN